MIDNKVVLKTTAEGEEVLTSEIFNISMDLRNKSVSINEKETVIDLAGAAVSMPDKYSHFGFGDVSPAPVPGQLNALTEADRVRNEQLASDIFELIKAYRLEKYAAASQA